MSALSTFRDLRLRLRVLLSPRRAERELHEALAFHIDAILRQE